LLQQIGAAPFELYTPHGDGEPIPAGVF